MKVRLRDRTYGMRRSKTPTHHPRKDREVGREAILGDTIAENFSKL